jgi:hypothetical protein
MRDTVVRFAVFRILFGLVLLADVWHVFAHQGLFGYPRPSILLILPLGVTLFAWSVVLICLIVGWRTRAACVVNYLFTAAMLGQNTTLSQTAGDSIMISLSLFAALLPCGAALSLDRRAGRIQKPAVGYVEFLALPVYLSTVYWDSAFHKLASPLWRAGLGIVSPASLPSLVWRDMSMMEAFSPTALQSMSWAVIVFELAFPLLWAWSRTRGFAVLAALAMHVGIAVVYPMPAFSGVMIAALSACLPASWYGGSSEEGNLPTARHRRASLAVATGWLLITALATLSGFSYPARAIWTFGGLDRYVFAATGIGQHAVFSDSLFHGYEYQIRIRLHDGTTLPYGNDNLLPIWARDRLWEDWWKRGQGPWVRISATEKRLVTWATHFAESDRSQAAVIEWRPQRVPLNNPDSAAFRDNNAISWRQLGHVDSQRVYWDRAPLDGDTLGKYMLRLKKSDDTGDRGNASGPP